MHGSGPSHEGPEGPPGTPVSVGIVSQVMYSRFGEKTNNLQECLPPRQTRPKRNASGFEKDLVPGTD